MSKAIKAALLSALVFPGAGHFYLKKTSAGFVFAVATLIPLYLIIAHMVGRASQIAEQIQRGAVPLDIAAITELLSKPSTETDPWLLNLAWAVLIFSWLIAIADAYRIGLTRVKIDTANG